MRTPINSSLLDTGPELRKHEGAWICSYESELLLSLEQVQKQIPPLIQILQNSIDAAGGIVGHIKAHVSESGKGMAFSATGGEVHCMDCSSPAVMIAFTAIAFLENGEFLRDSVEAFFAALNEYILLNNKGETQ